MPKTRWCLWNQKTNLTLNTTFIYIIYQVSSEFEIISDKPHKTNKDNRRFDHEAVSFFYYYLIFTQKLRKTTSRKIVNARKLL